MEFIFRGIVYGVWFLLIPQGFSSFLYEDSHFSLNIPGVLTSITRQNANDPTFGCPEEVRCDKKALYREFDGKCNNLKNPLQGSVGIKYLRFIPAEYNDDLTMCGLSKPALPKPREIVAALNNLTVQNSSKVTVMNMQWGQLISHDINRTPSVPEITCCLNCSAAPVESSDCAAIDVRDDPFYEQFGIECLENRRSAPAGTFCSNEREQVNGITAYIDGSVVYGISKEDAKNLRTLSNGQMKVREGGNTEENLNGNSCPASAVCPFTFLPTDLTNGQERVIAGDGRAVQQPSLTSMQTLFIRVHNDLASRLAVIHKDYDDEKLYQETRQLVIALIQHITYNEYLPSVLPTWALIKHGLPSLPPGSSYFKGYKKNVDASLRNGFSAAAYRFGHSLVAEIFELLNGNNVRLSESFVNHTFTFNFGTYPSDFLNGISTQISQLVDQNLVSSLSNKLFARGPNFEHGSDLYSTNIIRGRDHGLPSYTKWRDYCKLPKIQNFRDLEEVMRDGVAGEFEKLYKFVDDIDLYPALISEKPDSDGIVGPTITCLLSEQFWNLKVGDRFYYENKKHPNRFTLSQLNSIRRTCLGALLCRYTNTEEVPEFVMKVPSQGNRLQNCSDILAGTVLTEFEALF